MMSLLAVAVGGSIGASLRYLIWRVTHQHFAGSWPLGTFSANLLGCYLVGFVWMLTSEMEFISHGVDFLFLGVLGSLTTFSTYGLEAINLMRKGHVKTALAYVGFSNLMGLLLVVAGMMSGSGWMG